jgi:hypothetical protein
MSKKNDDTLGDIEQAKEELPVNIHSNREYIDVMP